MSRELRPYQKQDVAFVTSIPAAGIFNEQRTGKTPTALSAIVAKGCKKTLIVCPASAIYMWVEEFIAWTGRPCVACTGTFKKRTKLVEAWNYGGLVISYDTLKDKGNKLGDVGAIRLADPDSVILDEAHRIRGRTTETAKAVFYLNSIPYKLALTGTPTPGRAYEIWPILHFLYPNKFRGFTAFRDEYFFTSLQLNPNTGRPYMDIGGPKPIGEKYIQYVLSKMSVNRKRKEVMPWLPDKDYITVRLPKTPSQEKYLSELLEFFETEDVITKGVLDRLIRYRQICLDPELLNLKGESPKTEWILQYIKDYPERSIIIFSKFTSYLNKLHELIKDSREIVGATSVGLRHKVCQEFQAGKIKVLLINIDAGKEALTLDRGEAIIFTDRYPPVGDLLQAEDRFVATTKEKADKLHLIYNLVIKDSYDEEINSLIATRATEVDIINNFSKYVRKEETL